MEGIWTPVALNPVLLFARYQHGGHFAPHTDGSTIVNFNHRSLSSVIIYLNDAEGGETRMLQESQTQDLTQDAEGRFRGSSEYEISRIEPRVSLAIYALNLLLIRRSRPGSRGLGLGLTLSFISGLFSSSPSSHLTLITLIGSSFLLMLSRRDVF